MAVSKVKVKIYGQEYTVSGDKTEEEIKEIANYVNEKMHYIGKNSNLGSSTSVAVLSAVNITGEMLSERHQIEELKQKNEQLTGDARKYIELWDEAKKNLVRYRAELEELRMKADEDLRFKELEAKYKELESGFFDLQMENVQLKSRLEKIKDI